jgi:hypothetical protein
LTDRKQAAIRSPSLYTGIVIDTRNDLESFMPTHHTKNRLRSGLRFLQETFVEWWPKQGWLRRILVSIIGLVVVAVGCMYGIAQWYIHSNAHKPYIMGVSFIPAYAESLGVNPEQAMDALLDDVGVRHFRLVSYWDQGEPSPGSYDFSQTDWQFKKAESRGAKVTLSLGLRQPRWPECHMPEWAKTQDYQQWGPRLEAYTQAVVERYKNSPALDSYQVENEYFLKGFGICETIPHSMDRQRLVDEYNLVKRLDSSHTAIINRSNNALGWPVGKPTPDMFGISIYKRVWTPVLGRYIEYPFPAWFYGFVAGWQQIMTGRDMLMHELQAEAWGPRGQELKNISLEEQNKSFNAERFEGRFKFAEGTGMREVYFWGAEYWYYRKAAFNDNTVWDVAKQRFTDNRY